MTNHGLIDLNVLKDPTTDQYPSLEYWFKNRYSTVALNHVVDLTVFEESKKKKKGDKNEIVIPEPREVKLPSFTWFQEYVGKITVLKRLTVKISENGQFSKVFHGKASFLKKFDIISVIPLEQSCLQTVCGMTDVDLISIDCGEKPAWNMTKKIYNSALENSKYFELCYSPALRDPATLRNTVTLSHILYTIGKSKNLIVSSGSEDPFFLRSPYEVIHLYPFIGCTKGEWGKAVSQFLSHDEGGKEGRRGLLHGSIQ